MHLTSPKVQKDAPVVFMQAGLLASAETWVIHKEKSPAFVLLNSGFDVWLGNSRGDMYSRKNVNIDPDKDPKDFFQYSFYEMGKYDAPAQVDFVRKITGLDKITYLGHS